MRVSASRTQTARGVARSRRRCPRLSRSRPAAIQQLAYRYGAAIAEEARRKGFNVLLAGAVSILPRDPRTGRNFE